jgi:hypothetical protein
MASASPSTIDDRGVVLVHGHALGAAQVLEGRRLEVQTHFLGDHRTAGQDRDVLQHGLATITKARRLTGRNLDDAAHVVDYQRRQRFAFHIFGDDHQRLGRLGNLLEQRQQFANVGDLLVNQQDERRSDSTLMLSWLLMKYGER